MKLKKALSIILTAVLAIGVAVLAVGCKGGDDGFKEVEGKTNIRVATYNGGLGKAWLEDAARAFEAKFANKSFESGKTGVAISVEYCQGGDMMESQNLNKDLYLTEVFDYYTYVNKNRLADISDVVKGDLEEVGESNVTIEGKLDGSFKSFLTAKDGNYYAIPFYEGYTGFVYDRDLFADKGYYFDANGNFTGDENNLSLGRDGTKGTYDDGLPQTYSQFAKLVDKIRTDGVVPFLYGSDATAYFTKLLANFWADYEGKDNMLKNWDFTGSFNRISGFDGNVPSIDSYAFDAGNLSASVRELQKQPGKYYALKFLDEVFCSTANNYSGMKYLSAQEALIGSNVDGQTKQYAMLVDGVWWENEADLAGSFDNISNDDLTYNPADGSYKNTRRFAFMSLPMADELNASDANRKQTLYSGNDAFCFISANTTGAKLDVAKLFMQFLHTDSQMSAFTARTSVPRALNYQIAPTDLSKMTDFGKSVMEMKAASDIVYPYSGHQYYLTNSSTFALQRWGWRSKIGGGTAENPFLELKGTTTAKDYFNGLYQAH